jgi:hypothetical protein
LKIFQSVLPANHQNIKIVQNNVSVLKKNLWLNVWRIKRFL